MAFDASGLNVVVSSLSGGTYRVHSYETGDAASTVLGTDYFTDALSYGLRVDSLIQVFGPDGSDEGYLIRIDAIDTDGNGTAVRERVDNSAFIASGGTGLRTFSDRAVDRLHVLDFLAAGEAESIIDDDATELLNRAIDYVRDQNDATLAVRKFIIDGGGRIYRTEGSIDGTAIQTSHGWGIRNLIINANCTGKTALDLADSRHPFLENVLIVGDASNTPYIGLQLHRPAAATPGGGGTLIAVNTRGHFNRAAYLNHSAEEVAHIRCQFWNQKDANGTGEEAYCAVLDGAGHLTGLSEFATLETTASAFNQCSFYTCEFRKFSSNGSALFISRMLQSSFVNCYAVANDSAHIVISLDTNSIKALDIDMHCEGTAPPAVINFTGTSAVAGRLIGFKFRDQNINCTDTLFTTDTLTSVTFDGLEIDVGVSDETPTHIFDEPDKFEVRAGAGGAAKIHVPEAGLVDGLYEVFNSGIEADVVARDTTPRLRTYRGFPAHIEMEDDFTSHTLLSHWAQLDGSTAGSASVRTNTYGGVLRVTTGAAGTSLAENGIQLSGSLMWRANQGDLILEWIMAGGTLTDVAWFIGFTDQNSALEMPFTLSGTTLTSNATNAVGVLVDTAADNDTWHLVGVRADVDATMQNLAVAPANGTRERARLVVGSTGIARFYRNGALLGSAMNLAVTASTTLCPVIVGFGHSATARFIDLHYIRARMLREAF